MINSIAENKAQNTTNQGSIDQSKTLSTNTYFSGITSFFNPIQSKQSESESRQLDQNRTFERIIEALLYDGYVYSNSTVKSHTKLDGILLAKYLQTIDSKTINFSGTITTAQAQVAGSEYKGEIPINVGLLEYFIYHFRNNPENKLKINYESLISILIAKGANFDSSLVEKATELKIDLVKMWCDKHNIDILKSSIDDFVSKACPKEQLNTIIYRYFYEQPLENIYPHSIYDETSSKFINLFIKALEKRIAITQTELKKNKEQHEQLSEYSIDIIQSVNLTKTIAEQTKIINKYNYALNVAKTKLKAEELLETNVELTALLTKRHKQSTIISALSSDIEKYINFFDNTKKRILDKKKKLDNEAEAYAKKWTVDNDLAIQDIFNKTQEEITHKKNHTIYVTLEKNLKEHEKVIELSQTSLSKERDTLKAIEKEIEAKISKSNEAKNKYYELVEGREKGNVFGLESIDMGTFNISSCKSSLDLISFLNLHYFTMGNKLSIFKMAINNKKWDLINPIFASGILVDRIKSSNGTFPHFVKNYESSASDLIITIHLINPDSLGLVLKACNNPDSITNLPTWSYLVSKHSKQKSETDKSEIDSLKI